jgi:predicted metal-binding membrane protein
MWWTMMVAMMLPNAATLPFLAQYVVICGSLVHVSSASSQPLAAHG